MKPINMQLLINQRRYNSLILRNSIYQKHSNSKNRVRSSQYNEHVPNKTNQPTQEHIEEILRKTIIKVKPMPMHKKISYIQSGKIIRHFSKNTNSSSVCLFDNYIIRKTFKKNHIGIVLWKNELNTLIRLNSVPNVPKLIAYNNYTIFMTYCGDNISKSTIPLDWKQQINILFDNLKRVRVNPNDTVGKNICVMNNSIRLIDFGLSNSDMVDLETRRRRLLTNIFAFS